MSIPVLVFLAIDQAPFRIAILPYQLVSSRRVDYSRINHTQPPTSHYHSLPLPSPHISSEVRQPCKYRADPKHDPS
jgi:hypothetical protein